MEYSKNNVFNELFNQSVDQYLNKQNVKKLILTDTSTIFNKQNKEVKSRIPYNKNKRAIKISTITDSNGTPLTILVKEANKHDSKIFEETFDKMIDNQTFKEFINKNKNKITLLADKGYDSKFIRNKLKKNKIKSIISPNNRNTKDQLKKRFLNEKEKKIYKNRVRVEHFFGIVKRYPKVNSNVEQFMKKPLHPI